VPWQGAALAVDRLLSSDGFGSEGASLVQLVVSRDVSYSLEKSRQSRTFDDKSGHLATRQLIVIRNVEGNIKHWDSLGLFPGSSSTASDS